MWNRTREYIFKKLTSQLLNDREIIIEREKILFSQTEEASLVLIVVLQYFLVNYPGNLY